MPISVLIEGGFAEVRHPMTSHRLRRIASWLMERFADTDLIEPLIGDLIEQHHVWFCRQVLVLLFGGRNMVRLGVTLLSIALLIVVTTRVALLDYLILQIGTPLTMFVLASTSY